MKKGRGKGTPHPRKIRALRDLTNQQIDEDQEEARLRMVGKGKAKARAKESSDSPWVRLNAVHRRVSETLNKIDGLMVSAHRLGLGGKLKDHEVESFAAAMSEVESILVNWNSFLRLASTRSDTPPPESPTLMPGNGLTVKDVMPIEPEPDSETMVLSSSPLVPSSYTISSPMVFTPLPPRRSKPLAPTPHPSVRQVSQSLVSEDRVLSPVPAVPLTPHSAGVSQDKTGSAAYLSQDSTGSSFSSQMLTPALPSPPASVHLFRSAMGCSANGTLSTPSRSSSISSAAECMSPGMMTPLPPPDLLLRYPSLGQSVQASLPKCAPRSETPTAVSLRFSRFSPILITPPASRKAFIEPFSLRPPGLPNDHRLRSDGKQSLEEDESPADTDIVDDLTASTVKRLGEKGLEDELWLRLELGSAAGHTFVRKRSIDEDSGQQAPPWHGSGRKNLNQDMDSESLLSQPLQQGPTTSGKTSSL